MKGLPAMCCKHLLAASRDATTYGSFTFFARRSLLRTGKARTVLGCFSLQDAGALPGDLRTARSVLDCASPLALFPGGSESSWVME
jgi:hypothetical protein